MKMLIFGLENFKLIIYGTVSSRLRLDAEVQENQDMQMVRVQ